MIWLIMLYLAIGVFFDVKVFKSAGNSTTDKTILLMIHLILVMFWPLVMLMIIHTAATKVETKQSYLLEPSTEVKKEEEKS